ncbi:TniB family NTP-binding protein [Metabacillus litoralis]|uniref:TniB family NTP-binding protein n=1 Tax=Metabacillus litoralis TaxID=152268 RepID=UPI0020409A21|nr:TniB family NTP-binding protein [Metabacillus litoralis]MCM3412664.1 TniB family NTP-binding protein [Metabacillus litoralis]
MLAENKAKFEEMDFSQKKEHLKKLLIHHPRFKKAINKIQHCRESIDIFNEPQCMYVTGPSGSGKSTVFETYIKMYGKNSYSVTRTKKPILSATVPSPVRLSTFTEALLDKLGDPFPTNGTVGNKIYRLQELIKDCEVELILLDEFQHFIKTDKPKDSAVVADNFKSLINETKVSVVFFGLDGAEDVFIANEQLGRRATIKEELHPFSYKDQASTNEFRALLKQVDSKLPFVNLAGLGTPDFADKIMLATDGIMNSIMKLVKEAALFALKHEKETIEMSDLAMAFDLHAFFLSGPKEEKKNPFE